MTKEQHIAAIREILRDCGENSYGERMGVFEYTNSEVTMILSLGGNIIVTDDETGLYDHIEAYTPFEVQGMYEALLKKYGK